MDGISLTRIARAALLPAMIGISAAVPARGDDPVASVAGPASTRPAATTPAPRVVRRHPKPHELQRQARPDRPGFSPPIGDRRPPDPSADRPASDPTLPSSWWPRPAGADGAAAGRRIGAGRPPPMPRRPTVRRSTGGATAARRPAGDASVRRTQAGAPDLTAAPLPARGRGPADRPPGDAAGGQRRRAGRPVDHPPTGPLRRLTSNPDLVALRQGNPIAPRPRPSRSPGTSPPRSTPPSGSTTGRSP